MVLIHPCRALSGVIVVTEQDEDNSSFLFSYKRWGDWLNFKFLCALIFPGLSMHMLLPFYIMRR